MTTILDGRALAKELNAHTKIVVEQLKQQDVTPGIAVILVGEDPASQMYTRNKHKKALKLGLKSELKVLPPQTTQTELLNEIELLNNDDTINAILVQAPLPPQIDATTVTNAIAPQKDVDGFHPMNLGKLYANQDGHYPVACTPKGIMTLLKHYNIEISGKRAVIVGRSILVGKPMAALLLNKNATVTIANHYTQDLSSLTSMADILIVAAGQGHFIKSSQVKQDAVVIDVGIDHDEEGHLIGDVDFDNVSTKVSAITPVPGGVGPMTIATLMQQTVELTQWSKMNG